MAAAGIAITVASARPVGSPMTDWTDQFRSRPGRKTPLSWKSDAPELSSLDFPGYGAMVCATFGKFERHMRNKITKLLIVVVPRRTAGDG